MTRDIFFMWCAADSIEVKYFPTWSEADEYRKAHGGYLVEGFDRKGRRPNNVVPVLKNRIKIG